MVAFSLLTTPGLLEAAPVVTEVTEAGREVFSEVRPAPGLDGSPSGLLNKNK